MKTIEYLGTAYKQALDPLSPWLISFVAPAEEICAWAGIPRRTDSALNGFQRPDEESRVLKAKDYFSKFNTNQSPTSLVLGVHQQEPLHQLVKLVFEDGQNGPSRRCKIIVQIDSGEDLGLAIDRLKAQINTRLGGEIGAETDVADQEEILDSIVGADDPEDESLNDEEIELGRSLLQDLLIKLDDSQWCLENEQALRDMAKPATIIDGQHRVLGAKACERNIPFSVIAIMDCTWAEQVFQFTVVNYTAKGIPDQFITANAALSLTAEELGDLETRLQQAGIKVIEYELMRIINFDQGSPFKDLVNLTPKKKENLIGYKTMVQIGKAWYQGKDNAVRQILDHLYPELPGKNNTKNRLATWKQADWGLFFQDFWGVVFEQFSDKQTEEGFPLWTVGKSNLMIAVVLQQLQTQFLINLAAQDETFFEVSGEDALEAMRLKIKKRAHAFIGYFSPELFGKRWKLTSLNIGPGRETLNSVFRQMVETKGAFQWKSSGLLTGKAAA